MLSINKKNKNTDGFNLIELMIVIVILASLIAAGVVKYNSYSKRAGIITAANYMDGMKAKVTLYLANNNDTPPDDMSSQINIGLLDSNTKKYISNISYSKGSSGLPNNITVNINNATVLAYVAADFTSSIATSSTTPSRIYYVASIGNSASSEVSWSCYTQGLDTDSIPQSCKTTGSGSGGCGGTTRWNGSSCVSCLTGATCSGGIITVCPSGFYGTNCATAVSSCTGYVNGTGEQATCVTPCPANANCSGGLITSCKSGYYGDGCGTQCAGIISGTWPNVTCQPCSANAVCNNGAISGCQAGYYGSACTSQCQGTISGAWPSLVCTPCSGSTPYWNGTSCQGCPSHCNCSGGVVSGCQAGYYGSNCSTQCQGTISGTWPSLVCTPCSGSTPYWNGTSCAACPTNATSCSNGSITGCNAGYYGSTCTSQCQGTISGTWPNLVCTPCTGSTPYWNGTSCAVCPANAVCSNGSITGCNAGYYGSNCSSSYSSSCSTGYITGSGVTAVCNSCPTHAICSNGTITGCQSKYYGTGCASYCGGTSYLTGTGTTATCNSCSSGYICGFAVLGGGCSGNNPLLVNGTCYNCIGIWLYNYHLQSTCMACSSGTVFNNNWYGQPVCAIDSSSAYANTNASSWP